MNYDIEDFVTTFRKAGLDTTMLLTWYQTNLIETNQYNILAKGEAELYFILDPRKALCTVSSSPVSRIPNGRVAPVLEVIDKFMH